MIGIINKEYQHIIPQNLKRSLVVFNFEDAKLIFRDIDIIEFLICLNEKTMKFGYCFNLKEVEEFYNS